MKSNKIFFLLATLMVVFVVGVFMKSRVQSLLKPPVMALGDKQYRVAILVPVTHPALEEIRKGFVDTLNKSVSCSYDDYNANGNRTLMRNQAEEIVSKQYDLVFTIATGPALIMKEVCDQRASAIPIVAGAAEEPVAIKLIDSMESSGNNIVAVTDVDSFDEQIALLQFIKPTLKSILLVYNPTVGLEPKKQAIEQICKTKGIDFNTVEIFNLNDLVQKVPAMIDGHDTVMVLKDHVAVSGIESLINLCNRKHKTLYACDLNSGDKGAALSYGVYEYDDGVESAHKAVQILKDGKKPSDIPSSVCNDFKIKINTKTMVDQDLVLDSQLLKLIKLGEVV